MARDADQEFRLGLGGFIADLHEASPVRSDWSRLIEDVMYEWSEAPNLCGSPLEVLFLAHLMFATDGYERLRWDETPDIDEGPEWGTRYQLQGKIGKYAVDFLITTYCKGIKRRLVVECDGHDFHEKTREQAARDKKRDREITAAGCSILRFTGHEIHRSPEACIEEVAGIVADLMDECMVEAGVIQGRPRRPDV